MNKIFQFLRELFSAPVDAASLVKNQPAPKPVSMPVPIVSPEPSVELEVLEDFTPLPESASQPMSIEDVVESYQEERESIFSTSIPSSKSHPEFLELLLAERELLEELKKPGNEKLRLLTILHAKRKSIHTVRETITEVKINPSELSDYLIANHESRLQQLTAEAGLLKSGCQA